MLDAPAGLDGSVVPPALEVLGAAGDALVSLDVPLVDCAQAALVSSAAASAAAMGFSVMKLSFCEWWGLRLRSCNRGAATPALD
ncbi:MAG: hypothetical protein ABR570_00270 [Burkholderiales bacterium]